MPPEYLSVSQVTTFLLCPRKYRFHYIDDVPPERKSANLAFGSAVHSAIAWWEQQRIDGIKPLLDQALRIFRAGWTAQKADPLLDLEGEDPESFSVLGEALVKLYVERFESEAPPKAVEHRFEVRLPDPANGGMLPMPLVGYLDGLYDGGFVELKTTSRKSKPSNWGLQLAAYSFALRETTGKSPRLRLVQLVKTKEPKLQVDELTMTEKEEAWFVEVAGEVFRAIRARAFFPNPGWQCEGCEYRATCGS